MEEAIFSNLINNYCKLVKRNFEKGEDGIALLPEYYVNLRVENRQKISRAEINLPNYDEIFIQDGYYTLPISIAICNTRFSVILGVPGSGKTTVLKYLGLCCLGEDITNGQSECLENKIPIMINLGQFSNLISFNTLGLEKALAKSINGYLRHPNEELILDIVADLIRGGKLVILFDGLDEVPEKNKIFIMDEIINFVNAPNFNSRVVVASRPGGYKSLGYPFDEYILKGIETKQDIKLFTSNWIRILNNADNVSVEKISEPLIEQIDLTGPMSLIVSNPLLLRLFIEVYIKTKSISVNRSDLYNKYISILWKKAVERGAEETLESQIIEELIDLAWCLHTHALPAKNIHTNIIIEKMGLVEKAQEHLSFSHYTFREYFVALKMISLWNKDQTKKEVWKFIFSRLHLPEWREPILLFSGLLSKTNLSIFLGLLLKEQSDLEWILHRDVLIAIRILHESSFVDPNIEKRIIKRIKWLLSWRRIALWRSVFSFGIFMGWWPIIFLIINGVTGTPILILLFLWGVGLWQILSYSILRSWTDERVRIILELDKLNTKGVDILINLLDDPVVEVRRATTETIGKTLIKNPESLSYLVHQLTDTDNKVRVIAKDAIVSGGKFIEKYLKTILSTERNNRESIIECLNRIENLPTNLFSATKVIVRNESTEIILKKQKSLYRVLENNEKRLKSEIFFLTFFSVFTPDYIPKMEAMLEKLARIYAINNNQLIINKVPSKITRLTFFTLSVIVFLSIAAFGIITRVLETFLINNWQFNIINYLSQYPIWVSLIIFFLLTILIGFFTFMINLLLGFLTKKE